MKSLQAVTRIEFTARDLEAFLEAAGHPEPRDVALGEITFDERLKKNLRDPHAMVTLNTVVTIPAEAFLKALAKEGLTV